jgi:hypothetical protein
MIALIILLMLMAMDAAHAASKTCLTRAEAKEMYPRAHLYWSVGPRGRCWANSLSAARAMARSLPVPRAKNAPVLNVTSQTDEPGSRAIRLGAPPAEAVASLMPPYQERPSDGPRWDWLADARAAASEQDTPEPGGVVFSTFPGEQPDVWPAITRETPPAGPGGLAVVVATAVLAMVFGVMLARWHLRRLRM